MSNSGTREDTEVRAQLLELMPAPLYAHLIGLFNTVLLAVLVVTRSGAVWPLAWIVADLWLTAARMRLATSCRRAIRHGRPAPLGRLLVVAMTWVAMTGIGLAASIWTGDAACMVLSTGIAAVTAGTAIVRNAPVPRYACFVILTIGVPTCIAFLTCRLAGHWLVGIQLGVGLAGMCVMARQNHQMLAGLLRARMEIARLARRDSLSGLGNRAALYEKLGGWLERLAEEPGAARLKLGVLFLDLDRFKQINDGLGHAAGDALLRAVGHTLSRHLGPDDFACRSGGDEFVIVMRGAEPATVEAMARRIVAALSCPFDIGCQDPVRVGASIGIAMAPEHGLDVDALLSRADAALYLAKSDGRGRFRRCA